MYPNTDNYGIKMALFSPMGYNFYVFIRQVFVTRRLSCWSFVEKTSVKQSMNRKACSNFQMSFLHLSHMYPPVEASSAQEQYYVRSALHWQS